MRPLSIIARTACDMSAWFMVLFGVDVTIHGDMAPGGGFQGGAMVATFMALLIVTQGGKKILKWVSFDAYEVLVYTGLFLFLGLGLMGIGWGFDRTMMFNFATVPQALLDVVRPFWPASGTVSLMNLAVGLEVAGELSVLLLVMFRGVNMDDAVIDGKGKETGHDQR